MSRLFLMLALAACGGSKDGDNEPEPTTEPTAVREVDDVVFFGEGIANPFPNRHLIVDGKLALPADYLPTTPTPMPLETLEYRSGFSVAQSSVVRLPVLDTTGFPSPAAPLDGSVQMWDATSGEQIPCMAETDAYPAAPEPVLIVRPLQALETGHDVVVVLDRAVVERPDAMDALLEGDAPPPLDESISHYQGLVEVTGWDREDIGLIFDFPVADGRAPLVSALEQRSAQGAYTLSDIRTGEDVVDRAFKVATGSYTVDDFLVDDLALEVAADGSVSQQGTAESYLYIHIPESVADAPAGTVPVLVFGHGIFSHPANYLDDGSDPSGVVALADEAGAIVVATVWRGLTQSDLVGAAEVGADFGKFPNLTGRLVQGQVNTHTLLDLIEGGLLDDPQLAGASGQSLADSSRIQYYGISLGGIEGAVLQATSSKLDETALHVGGAMWSTMLERSSNWPTFEALLTASIPDAGDRQVLYALSQLWWDPVDPMSWTEELQEQPFLFQISIGDEQVPNLTSYALARSTDMQVLTPEVELPHQLQPVAAPASGGRILVAFDPETDLPPPTNRPAPVTNAHTTPRTWDSTREQVVRYLEDGTVEHLCGNSPCRASNQ